MLGLLVQAVLAVLQEESILTSRVMTPHAEARAQSRIFGISPVLDVCLTPLPTSGVPQINQPRQATSAICHIRACIHIESPTT